MLWSIVYAVNELSMPFQLKYCHSIASIDTFVCFGYSDSMAVNNLFIYNTNIGMSNLAMELTMQVSYSLPVSIYSIKQTMETNEIIERIWSHLRAKNMIISHLETPTDRQILMLSILVDYLIRMELYRMLTINLLQWLPHGLVLLFAQKNINIPIHESSKLIRAIEEHRDIQNSVENVILVIHHRKDAQLKRIRDILVFHSQLYRLETTIQNLDSIDINKRHDYLQNSFLSLNYKYPLNKEALCRKNAPLYASTKDIDALWSLTHKKLLSIELWNECHKLNQNGINPLSINYLHLYFCTTIEECEYYSTKFHNELVLVNSFIENDNKEQMIEKMASALQGIPLQVFQHVRQHTTQYRLLMYAFIMLVEDINKFSFSVNL